MSYLEQLKSENGHPEVLPKLTKGGFDSFDSEGGRHFSEKKAPVDVVNLATPDGPRSVTVPGNGPITDATTYRGKPTPEAVDLADRILTCLADLGRPATEAEITAAVDADPIMARNVLHRLAVEGIAEALPGGLYGIPPWPPRPADLPRACPLLRAGRHPSGCRFEAKLLRRMMAEGALPLPGGRCPLRRGCKVEGRSDGDT